MTAPTAPDPAAVRAAIDRLTATVAGMTPGEWRNVGDFAAIVNPVIDRDPWDEYLEIVMVTGIGTASDLAGIIALRNATPLLLRVADAAARMTAAFHAQDVVTMTEAQGEIMDAVYALAAAVPGAGGGE